MPKPAVRTLILLRRRRDTLEAELAENLLDNVVASTAAIAQLGIGANEERVVKFAGESWRVIRDVAGVRVLPLTVDEDI